MVQGTAGFDPRSGKTLVTFSRRPVRWRRNQLCMGCTGKALRRNVCGVETWNAAYGGRARDRRPAFLGWRSDGTAVEVRRRSRGDAARTLRTGHSSANIAGDRAGRGDRRADAPDVAATARPASVQ